MNDFTIIDWAATIPIDTYEFKNPLPSVIDLKPDNSLLPRHIARRCSKASKLALSSTLKLVERTSMPDYYAVFCSQHGEISNVLSLLADIAGETELSPTQFSQSVHNTASGLFTIVKQSNIPVNSIAAGSQTFLAGMIDALTWLQLNQDKTVLLTVFDEALPAIYQKPGMLYQQEYSVSLLLTQKIKNNMQLQMTHEATKRETKTCPPAIEFLAWYLTANTSCLSMQFGHRHYQWVQNGI